MPRCSTKSFKLDTEHAHTLGVLVETAVWFSVILGGEQKRDRGAPSCHHPVRGCVICLGNQKPKVKRRKQVLAGGCWVS